MRENPPSSVTLTPTAGSIRGIHGESPSLSEEVGAVRAIIKG